MNILRRVPAGTAMKNTFYEAALNLLPHPVAVCGADDMLIVYANDHATRELKLLRPEIADDGELVVGESIETFLPGAIAQSKALLNQDRGSHRRAIRLIGKSFDVSVREMSRDLNEPAQLIITWTTIEADGSPSSLEDLVTGGGEAHARIAQSSLDEAADAVFWIRADGSFGYFNDAACRMLGYSRDEMAALTVMDVDPACTTEAWTDAWNKMQPGSTRVYEWSQQRKDGRVIPVEITSNLVEYGGHKYNVALVRNITDRGHAEDELRSRETRLRQAQRLARLGNFARDLQTDQVWIDGIGEMFGVSNHDLADRKGFLDMLSAEDRTEFEATFAGAIKSRAPSYRAQYSVVLDSGDELEVEELGELTYDETGKPLHLSGTIQDITERWRAEERLEFTQFALDSAAEAVFFLRRDSSVSYVNDAACDLLGYARDELLSMTVCDFNPSLLPEIVEARWHEVRQQHDDAGGGFVFETINQKKDGTVIDVEVAGRFIEYGGETFHLTFTRDITDRKRAQEALRANEAQLRVITDTLPMRIAYIDRDQRYQFVNRLIEEHEGRPAEEIIGKTVEEILGDDRYERTRRHLTDALAGKSSVQTWRGPFGDKVADLRATFVANISDSGEALGTIMLLEDLSEAKALGEQLRQAQKMEAIGQLTGWGLAKSMGS